MEDVPRVEWKGIMKWNSARPRAIITMWLLYHGKIATKDMLLRFSFITESICNMCKMEDESINYVFF